MISVAEARERILAPLRPVPAETVALSAGWGRVLAAPVVARLTQPPADVSAMDGYAVRAADAQAGERLQVIGAAPAGHPFGGTVAPGQAVRIFTGSVMPAGADSVLLQEDAIASDGAVTVNETCRPARHIRRAGQDFTAGDLLIAPGRRLGASDIGLAAAANHPWLSVHRRPRVAILATGDEISLPGEPIGPGGIVSSNAHALAALVRAGGGEPLLLPIAADDRGVIAAAVDAAAGASLLVTTGGASVGDHDLVQDALGQRGFELGFWKVAMRPGKPLISGVVAGIPVLGLPGNPVSALICAALFMMPALDVLCGLQPGTVRTERAILGADLPANDARADHLRATIALDDQGRVVATAFPRQDSGMLSLLARSNALILRAPHAPASRQGEDVEIIRFSALGM